MNHDYWLKQTDEPLFPDILWSRPETKTTSGKLTIIGGNSHGFSAPGIAYASAASAGAGVIHVLLPDAIRKIVKTMLPDAEFAPSTPSGSFSVKALDSFLALSSWADCTLLAGDIGRNSETAILLERFCEKYYGLLTVTQDALDYFNEIPLALVDRPNTVVVASLAQLQKMFINTPTIIPITYSMGTLQLADALHDYTKTHPAIIIVKHENLVFVASDGRVSTTKLEAEIWRVTTASRASVFWMQNQSKAFETITTSLIE
jgi:NAD(P)H-hydrate repair Nnr-like enzyme with NAD(P)H-hydrate dehydratase domain